MTGVNFYGLCTGDFNTSFVPGSLKDASETLHLNYSETKAVARDSEFELPVNAGSEMEVGAISLALNFPSDKFKINDVYLNNDKNTPLMFAVSGDELKIAWTSPTPLALKPGQKLLTIKLLNSGLTATDDVVGFSLTPDPLNELADNKANVIKDAILVIDRLTANLSGNGAASSVDQIAFTNFPNPFSHTTTFAYSLPFDGKVTVEIYDMLGSKVDVLMDEMQKSGNYTLQLDADKLNPGIYTATIMLKGDRQQTTRTIKIVRN